MTAPLPQAPSITAVEEARPAHPAVAAGSDWREFKRGWRVLLAALLGVVTSAGVMPLYTFPLFVVPLAEQMGWKRGQLQITVTFFFIGMVLGSQIAGVLIRRFGLRPVATVSLVVYALAYALLSRIGGSIWTLYLAYMLLVMAGAGTLQITWTQLVNLWFDRHRGLALAIVLSGTGLCTLTVVPLVSALMSAYGWATCFVVLGAVPLVVMLPVVWLCMPADQEVAATPTAALARLGLTLGEALRSYRFWVMNIAFVLVVSGVLGILTNAFALMRDRGVPVQVAAGIVGIGGAALIGGRLLAGWLIDRLWAPAVACVMLMLPALGCLLYGSSGTDAVRLALASALVGVGAGAEYDVVSFLFARYFGMADYSRIYGAQFALISAGVCVAPMIFGVLIDRTGSYDAMLWVSGCGFIVGPLLLLTLGAYPKFVDRT